MWPIERENVYKLHVAKRELHKSIIRARRCHTHLNPKQLPHSLTVSAEDFQHHSRPHQLRLAAQPGLIFELLQRNGTPQCTHAHSDFIDHWLYNLPHPQMPYPAAQRRICTLYCYAPIIPRDYNTALPSVSSASLASSALSPF